LFALQNVADVNADLAKKQDIFVKHVKCEEAEADLFLV